VAIEVEVVATVGAVRVNLSPKTDEVAHHDREVLRAGRCRRGRIGAREALLYPAVGRAAIAIEEVRIVAFLVRKTLTVATGRLAVATGAVRFHHALVAAVERQIGL